MQRFRPLKTISLLIALAVLVLLSSISVHLYAASATPRAKLFVFIQGFNTALQDNTPPSKTFGKDGGISAYLRKTYPSAQFLMYSYDGDSSNGSPAPYSCRDTFTKSATADVLTLTKQLADYLKGKTNTDVYLVSHSFGSLVGYGYLSSLVIQHASGGIIPGTTGDRLAGLVTLDAPLGGIPNELYLTKPLLPAVYTTLCPSLIAHSTPAIDELLALFKTGTASPYGAQSSLPHILFNVNMTNEAVADAAAAQGIHVLTIGNVHDYLYDPAACKVLLGLLSIPHTDNYLSTQWVTDRGSGSGVYARTFAQSPQACNNITDITHNHGVAFTDPSVQTTLGQFIDNRPLTTLPVAPTTM